MYRLRRLDPETVTKAKALDCPKSAAHTSLNLNQQAFSSTSPANVRHDPFLQEHGPKIVQELFGQATPSYLGVSTQPRRLKT